MQLLTHFLRSSSLNEQTLTVPSAIVNYLPSYMYVFPERRLQKQKEKTLSCCGRFQFLLVAFRNTTTYREGDTKTDQIDKEPRLFWEGIVKTKHQSLSSLACMRLVPGANRAVRHICIRCIDLFYMNVNDFVTADTVSSQVKSSLFRQVSPISHRLQQV